MKPAVRVLVVDDSPVCRELLVGMLSADKRLLVVGVEADGEAAVQAAARLKPDVITMDIHLPRLDGFAATRRIMETCPTRIVMVTASSIPHEVAASFQALESGALAVLGKPLGPGDPRFAELREDIVRNVVLMAEVPVVRRWPAAAGARTARARPQPVAHAAGLRVVAIGASTGGPIALQSLLLRLRPNFPVPIVVVQHISTGFADGLAQWLSRSTPHAVQIALHDEHMKAGVVHVAPDGVHTTVHAGGRIALDDAAPEHGFRPSVACLFRSVAQHYGATAAGVLLTGMGQDGAQELGAMRQAGALTLVQDRASAVIHGMPGEAMRLGAAMHALSPADIADVLNRLMPVRE